VFAAFEVRDVEALRGRLLTAAGAAGGYVDVGALDTAPLWRDCAASLYSSLGAAGSLQTYQAQPPHMGDLNPAWRTAEVWRMALTTAAGWRDEAYCEIYG